jgi:ABC-type transport system involved in multi-copper enzyme maturation permease subunit
VLRTIALVGLESFTLLRRDKIFVPAIIVASLLSLFATQASMWAIEEFERTLFDVGCFGFQLTGCFIAIYWGTKTVADSRLEGALEVQLAAPVSRSAWLLGKFLGLTLALGTVAAIMLVVWQIMLQLTDFGWMSLGQLAVLLVMVLGWLVVAATAMLLGTFMRQAVALFVAGCVWVVGLTGALVASALPEGTSAALRAGLVALARFYDLQQFNLVDFTVRPLEGWGATLPLRVGYGALLIAVILTLACVIFERRDVAGT